MDRLSVFANLPFNHLLPSSNPSLRAYLRERGVTNPTPFPVIAIQSSDLQDERLPSDELLRSQLRFEGKSPVEVDDLVSRAQRVEYVARQVSELNRHLQTFASRDWIQHEVHVRRLTERKSRMARWWRGASRHLLVWSAVTAAALVVATALLARQGSALSPLLGVGVALVVLLTAYAGFSAWQLSRTTSDECAENDPAVWAQSVSAIEFSTTQPRMLDIEKLVQEHVEQDSAVLGDLIRPLLAATSELEETLRYCYWSYSAQLKAALNAARATGNESMASSAEIQLQEIGVVDTAFTPVEPTDMSGLTTPDFAPNRSFVEDRNLTIVLTTAFALVASSAILALPSLAIANDKCSYAISEVRINDCDDVTKLDAVELDLKGVDLAGRDTSQSDFTASDLTDADLSDTDLSYATLTGATLKNSSAQAAVLQGAFAAKADFRDADLTESEITGADLSNSQFADAVLREANFSDSLAPDSSFVGIDGDQTNFSNAGLQGADFTDASLTGAIFVGADLTGATLTGTDLSQANFTGATLRDIDFSQVDLSGAILDGVDLSGADLADLDLSGLSLAGADLSESTLTNASLAGANLVGADLTGAEITGLTLADASLGGVSVKALLDGGADLSSVDLSGADLSGLEGAEINLPGATLDGVDLSGYDLTGAILDAASLIGANLDGALMTGASFTDADLSDASFVVAEMSEANFSGALFNRADLTDVRALGSDFQGAGFAGTNLDGADFSDSNMRNARGLGQNAAAAQWVDATCPNGQESEICRS